MAGASLTLLRAEHEPRLDPRGLIAPGEQVAAIQRGDGRRPTLDELLVGVWEGLRSDHTAACPVCDGVLEPRYAAGPAPVAATCRSCGSSLS